ncbi:MAG TPA: hypothetical protein VMW62_07395 [Chloroflexota bacterium]|nr:hypothetical protein [Chloroflexota bacterium]
MSLLARLAAGAALALALVAEMPLAAAAAPSDYAVTGGWFYSETGGGTGRGFNLLDSGYDSRGQVTRFYSEFNRLGGVTALGYPASNVFQLPDGFIYQATQAALLQWHPSDQPNGAVELANVFDLLSQTGHDKDLQALGIPPPIADDGSGGNFTRAMQVRLGWLTQPQIQARYLANPNPASIPKWDTINSVLLYGLPTSQPQRTGPFIVQRFQRVAFQLWVDAVPGQPAPGTVVPILGGDLAKQFGVVPAPAQQPQSAAGAGAPPPPVAVQAPPSLQPAINLLLQYDQAHGSGYMKNLADHHVQVLAAPISDAGALGFFSPDENVIRISNNLVNEDVHDLADLISHESSHALDFWTGVDITSTQGCYNTEFKAFSHQADVWLSFYPHYKPAPTDQLDQFLNAVAQAVSGSPNAFLQKLTDVYHHQCAS